MKLTLTLVMPDRLVFMDDRGGLIGANHILDNGSALCEEPMPEDAVEVAPGAETDLCMACVNKIGLTVVDVAPLQ